MASRSKGEVRVEGKIWLWPVIGAAEPFLSIPLENTAAAGLLFSPHLTSPHLDAPLSYKYSEFERARAAHSCHTDADARYKFFHPRLKIAVF